MAYCCLPSLLTLCLVVMFLVSVSVVHARKPRNYNVRSFGAISDGKTDSSQALLAAWSQACKDSGSRVVFPKGKFLLNPVTLKGPCVGPITFLVRGILIAPDKSFLDSGEWILFDTLQNVAVGGNGKLDGHGAYAWTNPCSKPNSDCKPLPANMKFNNVNGGQINGITSINSKNFHIIIDNSHHIEIENMGIYAPADSPNTDGIHIARSDDVQVHNLDIGTGDDCISFGQGSTNIVVKEVNCGPGHGISIGSLGKYENEEDVSGIIVINCTLTNTTNGVRIKTWAPSPPSKLYNVTFQDIILNQVQNPIIVDQHYCPHDDCQHKGESQVQISDVKYVNIVGSSQDQVSAKIDCSKDVACASMDLRDLNIRYNGNHRTTAYCSFFNGRFHHCHSPNHCG